MERRRRGDGAHDARLNVDGVRGGRDRERERELRRRTPALTLQDKTSR